MFVLKMMFVYCKISLCNAVSRVAKKGEGWYIIMAVFSDILYKTSDRACCDHRLLLILCMEPIHDTLQQMSSHVNLWRSRSNALRGPLDVSIELYKQHNYSKL